MLLLTLAMIMMMNFSSRLGKGFRSWKVCWLCTDYHTGSAAQGSVVTSFFIY